MRKNKKPPSTNHGQIRGGTASVPLWVWPWLLLGGFLFFLMVEAEKLILRLARPR